MDRREFVKDMAVLGAAAVGLGPSTALGAAEEPNARRIPRWRGFNLQGRFSTPDRPYEGPAFEEADFAAMAEWGFDFARLPLSYWSWGSKDDWSQIREPPLKQIDRAVDLGRQYGVHINLNFHRIPGYCINGRDLEPADLFMGRKAERDRALAAAAFRGRGRRQFVRQPRQPYQLLRQPALPCAGAR